jgi:hypothetical protein
MRGAAAGKDLLFFGANRSTPDNFFGLEAK